MANTAPSRRHRSRVAIIALLLGSAVIASVVLLKPTPQPQPRAERPAPEVTVVTAAPGPVALQIEAQGTVAPKIAVDLVARVAGQVVAIAPQFAAGGFFEAGQTLLQIERADYQFAVARARAQLAKADEALALERGRARQAEREWRDLGDEVANALFLRQPQLAAAQAAQAAAQADLDKAQLDLERTRITLPYAGRVAEISVNVGQFVTPGSRLGRVFGAASVELRLPLTLRQADLIELPSRHSSALPAVEVKLSDSLVERRWRGQLVRSEASLDTRSRMLVAVAELDGVDAADLPVGAFVEALISGRRVDDAMVLPRSALYRGDQVLQVDADSRIHYRTVEVLQNRADSVVVRGLAPGAQIVTTHLSLAIEGMRVTVAKAVESGQ